MSFLITSCLTGVVVIISILQTVEAVSFVPGNKLDSDLQVKTTSGVVQGKRNILDDGSIMLSYKGIPYAKPPVQKLRFRAPEPNSIWQGVLDATEDPPSCIEVVLENSRIFLSNGSEDCLYLNVYTKKSPQESGLLPVLFWIYGGSFLEGNASQNVYGPELLVEDNVVVVTFNYRVGVFGFLSTGDMASPGNYGLKDQNLALKWVKKNIVAFGGNSNMITISGESAGAASVFYHLTSAKSRGLFQGAIAQSGTSLSFWSLASNPLKVAWDHAISLNIKANTTKDLIRKLRTVDAYELATATIRIFVVNSVLAYQYGLTYAPTIEPKHKDAFVTKFSYEALKSGDFARVPMMVGVNSMEANFNLLGNPIVRSFYTVLDISPQLLAWPSLNSKTSIKRREIGLKIRKHYFKSDSFSIADLKEIMKCVGDMAFVRPIMKSVELVSKFVPVYMTVFDYQGTSGKNFFNYKFRKAIDLGTSHAEDLAYLWKNLLDTFGGNKDDKLISKMWTRLWTNFAKSLNPTPKPEKLLQNVIWPRCEYKSNFTYLRFDKKLSLDQNFQKDDMDFWQELHVNYAEGPLKLY